MNDLQGLSPLSAMLEIPKIGRQSASQKARKRERERERHLRMKEGKTEMIEKRFTKDTKILCSQ